MKKQAIRFILWLSQFFEKYECEGCKRRKAKLKQILNNMPCQNCPKEGQTNEPQVVVGWKAWYADGKKYVGKTLSQWQQLPDDGLLVVMLYYNRFDTQGTTRYRRILQGNDYYWIAPGKLDGIYGHGDEPPEKILARYPKAIIKRGIWADDAHYKQTVEEAMNDHAISELGLPPEAGTTDH